MQLPILFKTQPNTNLLVYLMLDFSRLDQKIKTLSGNNELEPEGLCNRVINDILRIISKRKIRPVKC